MSTCEICSADTTGGERFCDAHASWLDVVFSVPKLTRAELAAKIEGPAPSPDDLCVCGGKREAHDKDGPPYLRCDDFEPFEGPTESCACNDFADKPCPVHPGEANTINADARAVKAILTAGPATVPAPRMSWALKTAREALRGAAWSNGPTLQAITAAILQAETTGYERAIAVLREHDAPIARACANMLEKNK